MLPEVYESWENYATQHNIDLNLSLGIVVICAGFFLVYFVEEAAHFIADRHAHNKTDVTIHRAVSIRGCPISLEGPSPPCDSMSCQGEQGEPSCQDNSICQLEPNDCTDKEYCREVIASATESSALRNHNVLHHKEGALKKGLTRNECYGTFQHTDQSEVVDQVDRQDHVQELRTVRGYSSHSYG